MKYILISSVLSKHYLKVMCLCETPAQGSLHDVRMTQQQFKWQPLQVTLHSLWQQFLCWFDFTLISWVNRLRQTKQCQAKQDVIGFWSMATPLEARFHLLFRRHLECNGSDYIPPVVSRWLCPHRPLGGCCWQSCPAALFESYQDLSSSLLRI